ncbi:MAG TPA: patatin-like phospholipase family protein [Thermoanaerobaculia bacterium]|nr:patatin-like phospholipase family protein [Thermoanaerobaculia bacterium]
MAYRIRTRDEHFKGDGEPKRILALDGGGLRGILTLGILQQIEDELRARHGGDAGFRLCHYFDLIAGTSTGAIIAAALAIGLTVDQITTRYRQLGSRVFERSFLRHGLFRAKYDARLLIEELKDLFGAEEILGGKSLLTGLLVVIKRLDTASPWPVSNNPNGKYFRSRSGGTIGNGDYKLWQAVRASTAAPDYFDPERITIAQMPEHTPVYGDFVDGGVSPYNNPALQAFMYATIGGYNVKWGIGEDELLLVSVGTGAHDPAVQRSEMAAAHALRSLLSMMDDCAALQETLLQWMSRSPTARKIDGELQQLDGDLIAGAPLMTYVRYNAGLDAASIRDLLGKEATEIAVENLSAMDAPENMDALHKIGLFAGKRNVRSDHFPRGFDLN